MNRWHFIVDPVRHRAYWRAMAEGQDGLEVDTPFGKAVNIFMPPPASDEDWYCDYCNDPMEVVDAYGQPIPTISQGSYAICGPCVAKAITEYQELSPDMSELFPAGAINACALPCCRPRIEALLGGHHHG